MKRKKAAAIFLTVCILLLMAGCGQKGENKDLTGAGTNLEQTGSGQDTKAEHADTAGQTEGAEESTQAESSDIPVHTYSWEEMTISIPDSWEGKYQVEEYERGFSLIQTASFEKENGMGILCGFYRTDGMIQNIPGATPLAYTDEYIYYMSVPTDVSFYYEDEAISQEYHEMYDWVDMIAASVSIDKEGVKYDPDEYIFPMSSTVLLDEMDLLNYNDNELAIARNEIYARHGRQFQDFYLSNYFTSCSWYEGTVSSEAFDDAVLNQTEKDNVLKIQSAEAAYKREHPYPKEYQVGSMASEDLDGDGRTEEIQYILEAREIDGGYNGTIVIGGQTFDLESYQDVWLSDPLETFYITDISPYFAGLEIAVLDNGPSDDPITYFFIYNGELIYIGSVGGHPFKQISGYNGFANAGSVTGETVLDFTHTCHAYGNWWYDYQNQELVYQDTGYYVNKPEYPHELYEDLMVYLSMDERSLTKTFPAQKEVFFVGTDGKEWVLIRGKDGSKGYVHIVDGKIAGLSKTPDEVFSGLGFSG